MRGNFGSYALLGLRKVRGFCATSECKPIRVEGITDRQLPTREKPPHILLYDDVTRWNSAISVPGLDFPSSGIPYLRSTASWLNIFLAQ